MDFQDIDYLEMYAEDMQKTAELFCTCYGFRKVAEAGPETGEPASRSLLLRQGRIQLLITSAVSPDHPSVEFVKLHGDGIRDVAFRTPDAVGAFHAALKRGARPVMDPVVIEDDGGKLIRATIAGVGDVVHSFIQREGVGDTFVPGRFRPIAPSSEPPVELFTSLDHIAICLRAGMLEPSMAYYCDVLGFHQSHEENVYTEYSGMNSKVAESGSGKIRFPLMEPAPSKRPGQIEQFCERHSGPGVQHVAMLTADITSTVRQLLARDVVILEAPPRYYENVEARVGKLDEELNILRELNILIDRDQWGYLLQSFTRSAHARRTLFFEAIQRRDARGFGSANVRALYQAVEQDFSRA